jgi:hypothetical protein
MPRPGSRVIPAGWVEHHRPVAEATFIGAKIRLRDPADDTVGEFDEDTGTRPVVKAAPYYDGPCRVQQQKQPQVGTTGDQRVSTHDYLVAVPIAVTAVAGGHIGEVYECAADPTLIGRPLKVTDVMRGSLAWERDLIVIDQLG